MRTIAIQLQRLSITSFLVINRRLLLLYEQGLIDLEPSWIVLSSNDFGVVNHNFPRQSHVMLLFSVRLRCPRAKMHRYSSRKCGLRLSNIRLRGLFNATIYDTIVLVNDVILLEERWWGSLVVFHDQRFNIIAVIIDGKF